MKLFCPWCGNKITKCKTTKRRSIADKDFSIGSCQHCGKMYRYSGVEKYKLFDFSGFASILLVSSILFIIAYVITESLLYFIIWVMLLLVYYISLSIVRAESPFAFITRRLIITNDYPSRLENKYDNVPFDYHFKVEVTFPQNAKRKYQHPEKYFVAKKICIAEFVLDGAGKNVKQIPVVINDVRFSSKHTAECNMGFVKEEDVSKLNSIFKKNFSLSDFDRQFAAGMVTEVYDFEKPKK